MRKKNFIIPLAVLIFVLCTTTAHAYEEEKIDTQNSSSTEYENASNNDSVNVTYDVEIETIQIDENSGKTGDSSEKSTIEENTYTSIYIKQILTDILNMVASDNGKISEENYKMLCDNLENVDSNPTVFQISDDCQIKSYCFEGSKVFQFQTAMSEFFFVNIEGRCYSIEVQ